MSILLELNALMNKLDIPVETGIFSNEAPPDVYVVIVPMVETFELFANNRPGYERQEARIALYCNGNYFWYKYQITKAVINADFTVTLRQYIGHEDNYTYHHYNIDVLKIYPLEGLEWQQ